MKPAARTWKEQMQLWMSMPWILGWPKGGTGCIGETSKGCSSSYLSRAGRPHLQRKILLPMSLLLGSVTDIITSNSHFWRKSGAIIWHCSIHFETYARTRKWVFDNICNYVPNKCLKGHGFRAVKQKCQHWNRWNVPSHLWDTSMHFQCCVDPSFSSKRGYLCS